MGGAFQGDTYRNACYENPITDKNWVVLKLIGEISNHSSIGSYLEIVLDNGRKIFRNINTGGSFGSSSLQAEIGLGKNNLIKKLSIIWPSGKNQTFKNLISNKKYMIFENGSKIVEVKYNKLNLIAEKHNHEHN